MNAWGFGPEPRGALPDAEETARRAAAVGMDKFELQQQGDATLLRKKHPDLYLDLSSIAKGFGVDAVAQVLEDAGIGDYLVEIGGEIRSAGKSPAGEPWRIAIEHPEPPHPAYLIIALPHHGLATSGGYRNFRTRPTQTNSQRLSSQNKHLPHQSCRRAGLFVAPIPHQNK